MSREEYLKELKFRLIDLPGEELMQMIDYYEELILDGMEQGYTEEEVIRRLESPEKAAEKIRGEYGGLVVYRAGDSRQKGKQGYEAEDLIHTVRIESGNMRIRIRAAQSGPVRVLFKPREGQDQVTFQEENGVFFFKHERKETSRLDWLGQFFDLQLLILELPVRFAGNLSVQTRNAAIFAEGLGNLAKAEFCCGNGKIRIKNSCMEQLSIKAGNGKVDLSSLMGNQLEAISGNGLIAARECRFMQQLILQTQNGAVTGKNLIGDHISMQSRNGFITGTIIGNEKDYNLESSTQNGFNNLKNRYSPERGKSLEAKTHNGGIQIEFTS